MEIRLDSWGFVLETGVLDIYFQRTGIIAVIAIYVGLRLRKTYNERKLREALAEKRRDK